MDDNKKNKLFKGFKGKGKKEHEEQEQVQEVQKADAKPAEQNSPQPADRAEKEAPEESVAEQNEKDMVFRLYLKWCQIRELTPVEGLFRRWMWQPAAEESGLLPSSMDLELQEKIFLMRLSSASNKILQQLAEAEQRAENEPEALLTGLPDIDAAVHIYVPQGNVAAFLCVLPPFGQGRPLDRPLLYDTLKTNGVCSGILQDTVERIADEQRYFQIYIVALGTQPIPGKDGTVIEYIPREETVSFEENEEGQVDYRNLNLFRSIKKGDVICDIIPPTEGTPGKDIKGTSIKAQKGKAASVPSGKNTVLSEDGRQLLADNDGFVSFKQGQFCIENQLVIPGNVDMSVGNLDFLGSILVYGDVISGFQLKATGDIHVKGRVEGAELIAGENIRIDEGMNGSNRGELRAGKSIHSVFLENVKVRANEDVHAQSIVSCEVYCNGSIYVDQGVGAIIGGKLMATKTVVAKVIGSKAQRKTEIILGMLPDEMTKNDERIKELDATRKTRSLLKKNLEYLKKIESLSEEKAAILAQLIEQEQLYEVKEKDLERQIAQFNGRSVDYSQCFVTGGMLFPPTKIVIGGRAYTFDAVSAKCRLHLSEEGEIVVGLDYNDNRDN